MTKKQFKEQCSFQVYGNGRTKRNAIYFDWQTNANGNGFKYMVKTSVQNYKLNELFNILYEWVVFGTPPDWSVINKYAPTDKERFKISIMG